MAGAPPLPPSLRGMTKMPSEGPSGVTEGDQVRDGSGDDGIGGVAVPAGDGEQPRPGEAASPPAAGAPPSCAGERERLRPGEVGAPPRCSGHAIAMNSSIADDIAPRIATAQSGKRRCDGRSAGRAEPNVSGCLRLSYLALAARKSDDIAKWSRWDNWMAGWWWMGGDDISRPGPRCHRNSNRYNRSTSSTSRD